MPSLLKKIIKNPVKTLTGPLREAVKHVPVVGHVADNVLRGAAMAIDHTTVGGILGMAIDATHVTEDLVNHGVNIVTGKSKIQEQAEQQVQQYKKDFERLKQDSLKNLELGYQNNLQEIHRTIQNIENEKERLLINLATELEDLHIQEIRELDADLVVAQAAERAIILERENGLERMQLLERQGEEQFVAFVAEINARYEPLLQQCDNDLNAIRQQEQAMSLEYDNQRHSIIDQYNSQLDNIIKSIEDHKKKATRRATRDFAITVASTAVAGAVAPQIATALGISSKVGVAMVQAATASTVHSVATGQIEQLPAALLKNTATKGLIAISSVGASNVVNNIGESKLGSLGNAVVVGAAVGSANTIMQGGNILGNIATSIAGESAGVVISEQSSICDKPSRDGMQGAVVGGVKAVIAGENIATGALVDGVREYITGVATVEIASVASYTNQQSMSLEQQNKCSDDLPESDKTSKSIDKINVKKPDSLPEDRTQSSLNGALIFSKKVIDKYDLVTSKAKEKYSLINQSFEEISSISHEEESSITKVRKLLNSVKEIPVMGIMQRNTEFQPDAALYANGFHLDLSTNHHSTENRTTYAYDVVRLGTKKFNFGFTPYVSATNSMETPVAGMDLQATTATSITRGINLVTAQTDNISASVDVLRYDRSDTLSMQARPLSSRKAGLLIGNVEQHKRASLAVVSASLNNVKVPFFGACTGQIRGDIDGVNLNVKSTRKPLFYEADLTWNVTCRPTRSDQEPKRANKLNTPKARP